MFERGVRECFSLMFIQSCLSLQHSLRARTHRYRSSCSQSLGETSKTCLDMDDTCILCMYDRFFDSNQGFLDSWCVDESWRVFGMYER